MPEKEPRHLADKKRKLRMLEKADPFKKLGWPRHLEFIKNTEVYDANNTLRRELSLSIGQSDFENNLNKFPLKAKDKLYRKNLLELLSLPVVVDEAFMRALILKKGGNKKYMELLTFFVSMGSPVTPAFVRALSIEKATDKKYVAAIKDLALNGVFINNRVLEDVLDEHLYDPKYIAAIKKYAYLVSRPKFGENDESILTALPPYKILNKAYMATVEGLYKAGVLFDPMSLRNFKLHHAFDKTLVSSLKRLHEIGVKVDYSILDVDLLEGRRNKKLLDLAFEFTKRGYPLGGDTLKHLSNMIVKGESVNFEILDKLESAGVTIDDRFLAAYLEKGPAISPTPLEFLLNAARAGVTIDVSLYAWMLSDDSFLNRPMVANAKAGGFRKVHFDAIRKLVANGFVVNSKFFYSLMMRDIESPHAVAQYIKKGRAMKKLLAGVKGVNIASILADPARAKLVENWHKAGGLLNENIVDLLLSTKDPIDYKAQDPARIRLFSVFAKHGLYISDSSFRGFDSFDYKRPGYMKRLEEVAMMFAELGFKADGVDKLNKLSLEQLNEYYGKNWEFALSKIKMTGIDMGGVGMRLSPELLLKARLLPPRYLDDLIYLARNGVMVDYQFLYPHTQRLISKNGVIEFMVDAARNGVKVNDIFLGGLNDEILGNDRYKEIYIDLLKADVNCYYLRERFPNLLKRLFTDDKFRKHVLDFSLVYPYTSTLSANEGPAAEEAALNPAYLNGIKALVLAGVDPYGQFLAGLSEEKATNKDYIAALIRLHNMGVVFQPWFLYAFTIDHARSRKLFTRLEKLSEAGVWINHNVATLELLMADAEPLFRRLLATVKKFKSLGMSINDGMVKSLTPDKLSNDRYLEVAEFLHSKGLYVNGEFLEAFTTEKALDKNYPGALARLHEGGVSVSAQLVRAFSLSHGSRKVAVENLFRLQKAGVKIVPSSFGRFKEGVLLNNKWVDSLIFLYGEGNKVGRSEDLSFLQGLDVARGTNDKYVKILAKLLKNKHFRISIVNLADREYVALFFAKYKDFYPYVYYGRYDPVSFKRFFEVKKGLKPRSLEMHLVDELIKGQVLPFIRSINDLHNETLEVRQKEIRGLPPEALYSLVVHGAQELFTSSFQGVVYPVLMETMKEKGLDADSFLDAVDPKRNGFRMFLQVFSKYNRTDPFLDTIEDPAKKLALLREFILGLDEQNHGLENAVAISETLQLLRKNKGLTIPLEGFLREAYQKATGNEKIMYATIASMHEYNSRTNKDFFAEMASKYPIKNVRSIKHSDLVNKKGDIIQWYFFYDDADGHGSFNNMMRFYDKPGSGWTKTDKKEYVILTKRRGRTKILKYVNKPQEEDSIAAVQKAIESKDLSAIEIVHRGHSYHAEKTIYHIPKTAKLVFLGSCGGFGNVSSVLRAAEGAHIISTKGTGTMRVNDPLLNMIDDAQLSGEGIVWDSFWKKARLKIRDERFEEYVNPAYNAAALLIDAYRKYVRGGEIN